MSFRLRAALTMAILTAIALGCAFAAVSAAFNGFQRRQLDASLRAVAEQEAQEAPSHGFAFSDGPGPAANDVGPLTKYGVIYGEGGSVLSATAPFDVAPPPEDALPSARGDAFDFWFRERHLRGVTARIPGHPQKLLFLAAPREDLDGDETFLLSAMLVAFLVALTWGAAVAYWMGGRLTRDHRAIAEVARNVAGGDLSAKVHVNSADPELAQLGRDINDMVTRLGEHRASEQRFIAHAAHELRSPLTVLYGELQQALRKDRGAAEYQKAIASALAATRQLKLLADDLLTLTRTRAGAAVNEVGTPLQRVVADALALIAPLVTERAVRLETNIGENCWISDWNGDTARLIRNLLENAVLHSPPGGVIRLEAANREKLVRVQVSDQGPGVKESERHAIFEPFFRSNVASKGHGSGLGLGIAREIARAHGGDVALAPAGDDHDGGGRFIVSLPAATPEG